MTRTHASFFLKAVALLLIVAPALAQGEQGQPEMTPEQQAMMEAYMKAATPGEPHKMLASQAGTYDVKVKSWHEPGAPATEETGTATRMAVEAPGIPGTPVATPVS